MRNSSESVHGSGARGSGRTHKQLASLRSGDVYLVHNEVMIRHSREILRKLNIPNVKIILMSEYDCTRPDKLRGLAGWIEVDHWLRPKMGDGLIRWIDVQNQRYAE